MLRAPASRVLHAVGEAPCRQPSKSLQRKRRPRTVAAQALASHVVARLDAHARVQIEPVALERERRLLTVRAVELLARGDPLGTEYVEEVQDRIYRFRRAMHPPNTQIREWHPGIDAVECASRKGCASC